MDLSRELLHFAGATNTERAAGWDIESRRAGRGKNGIGFSTGDTAIRTGKMDLCLPLVREHHIIVLRHIRLGRGWLLKALLVIVVHVKAKTRQRIAHRLHEWL